MPFLGDFQSQVAFTGSLVGALHNTDAPGINFSLIETFNFANGTGSGQANKLVVKQSTAGSIADTYLFSTGSVTDVHGDLVTLTKITEVLIVNLSVVSGDYISVTGDFITTHFGNLASRIVRNSASTTKFGYFHRRNPAGWAVSGAADAIALTRVVNNAPFVLAVVGTE